MTAGGSNDKLLYEALESFRATLPPSSITHFLIPLLIAGPPVPSQAVAAGQAGAEALSSDARPPAEEGASAMAVDGEAGEAGYPEEGEAFLLSDEGLSREEGLLETVKFRHRLLFVPLLLALERTYTGFVTSLLTHLTEDTLQGSRRAWGMWTAYLLCRDWHSHFPKARGLAGFQLRGAIRFSLRDKAPDKWTTAEAGHMAAPAPRQYQVRRSATIACIPSMSTQTHYPAYGMLWAFASSCACMVVPTGVRGSVPRCPGEACEGVEGGGRGPSTSRPTGRLGRTA